MVPLSEQDPQRWQRSLSDEAIGYLNQASALGPDTVRVIQAKIHAAWCARHTLESPPPWPQVLSLYDALLVRRDDPVVRLNRLVAVAEVHGVESALSELESQVSGNGVADARLMVRSRLQCRGCRHLPLEPLVDFSDARCE